MLVTFNPIPPSFSKNKQIKKQYLQDQRPLLHVPKPWGLWASLPASLEGQEEMKADSEMFLGETTSRLVWDGTLLDDLKPKGQNCEADKGCAQFPCLPIPDPLSLPRRCLFLDTSVP